ncbi:MAG: YtfJ family protein [Sulfurimonadaceae bacterium]
MNKMFLLSLFLSLSLGAVEIGQTLPTVTLDEERGGRVTGEAWSSAELKGKVHLLFYVDPDEKDLNNDLSDAVKAAELDRSKYASVAIINMAATWKPNFAINSALKSKQEKFPHTIYVKDMDKHVVNGWNVADDNSDIIVFDKEGRVLFYHEGKVEGEQINEVIALIKEHM